MFLRDHFQSTQNYVYALFTMLVKSVSYDEY